MAHTHKHRDQLLSRVRKLKGQVESVERALESGLECAEVLHRVAACRGSLTSLLVQVLEGHIREHVVDEDAPASSEQHEAAEQVISVIRSYLK